MQRWPAVACCFVVRHASSSTGTEQEPSRSGWLGNRGETPKLAASNGWAICAGMAMEASELMVDKLKLTERRTRSRTVQSRKICWSVITATTAGVLIQSIYFSAPIKTMSMT